MGKNIKSEDGRIHVGKSSYGPLFCLDLLSILESMIYAGAESKDDLRRYCLLAQAIRGLERGDPLAFASLTTVKVESLGVKDLWMWDNESRSRSQRPIKYNQLTISEELLSAQEVIDHLRKFDFVGEEKEELSFEDVLEDLRDKTGTNPYEAGDPPSYINLKNENYQVYFFVMPGFEGSWIPTYTDFS